MTSELLYGAVAPTRQRTTARKRWRLLARALGHSADFLEAELLGEAPEISVRRFSSFGLLRPVLLESEPDCSWWLYTALLDGRLCELLVRRLSKCFTANELVGFNNTGNVCVWPSEECLAYYLLKVRARRARAEPFEWSLRLPGAGRMAARGAAIGNFAGKGLANRDGIGETFGED